MCVVVCAFLTRLEISIVDSESVCCVYVEEHTAQAMPVDWKAVKMIIAQSQGTLLLSQLGIITNARQYKNVMSQTDENGIHIK